MDAHVGISVLLETYGVRDRIKCKLAGWSKDEFVALKAPLTPGIRSRVTEGSQMSVRYLHGGELVGFRAEYVDFVVKPFPLLFVSYPFMFETHSLRGGHRLECNLLAALSVNRNSYRGVILDISPGGCRFFFDPEEGPLPELAKELQVDGYFSILGGSSPHPFEARVASVEHYKSRGEVGLRFENPDAALPAGLTTYLDEVSEILLRLKP